MSLKPVIVALLFGALVTAQQPRVPTVADVQRMTARFAPTELSIDQSRLSPEERGVLAKLVDASRIVDALFLRQRWSGNEAMLLDLAHDDTPAGRARLHYFLLNKGPWSAIDGNVPFIANAPQRPSGGTFYPDDATRDELERWMASLSDGERRRATGFFSVIRRGPNGTFTIVPYNLEYQNELTGAASLLKEAAAGASEPTLKTYLTKRADAFLSNDYYDSDVAWMELQGRIQPTIGPYEVYEDEFFNYKAAFESFITVLDEEESAKLKKYSGELQDIENHLPIEPPLRNPKLGSLAPITVVNEIFAAGDAAHGVQTAAFNLPNDERVLREKGSKRVLLKNVQEAKFAKTLVPISKVVLATADQKDVSFDAFFSWMLVHELMHGLGPHDITIAGQQTTVRQALKDKGSFLEEAKADISALFALQYMIDKGMLPATFERPLYTSYLASTFRSVRFGLTEAHGRGTVLQFNYLVDHGAFVVSPSGTFAVDRTRIREAVAGLTRDIMTIQAEGSYEKAKALEDRLVVIRPELQRALDRLRSVPVDIEPIFTTADRLRNETIPGRK